MYGNYQGYGYQPNYQQPNYMQRQYAPQPSQMPQNQQQAFAPIQTPPPMETPIQDIKFVNRAQAEAYIVFPNTKVMLIDTENGMAYIKTADGRHCLYVFAEGSELASGDMELRVIDVTGG